MPFASNKEFSPENRDQVWLCDSPLVESSEQMNMHGSKSFKTAVKLGLMPFDQLPEHESNFESHRKSMRPTMGEDAQFF